ncbi:hypothetical protein ROZALSC1DRAFT_16842 [Rozella allomycis CSF55]|uniref:Pru domain-containing protein n=1 Tax=Rozella allomycis (strain CSF55) TaxID=988480 RepID=A0A4P9YCJ2_ROZAC|nr:hypothetical protein ROZALSC1DRAFT_16842 [Rozella allomycis CSF55]
MSSIFAAPVAATTSSDRIEFKAGKLSQQGRLVVPDPRKGLISVKISDDGLLHLMWIDRRTNMTEDDLIVFPDEAELVHVPQCTTGRVFVLKYKTSSQRFFIWMQDSNDKNDSDIVKRVNVMINNPPSASHNSTNVFGGSIGSQNQNEMLSAMLRGSGLGGNQNNSSGSSQTTTNQSTNFDTVISSITNPSKCYNEYKPRCRYASFTRSCSQPLAKYAIFGALATRR